MYFHNFYNGTIYFKQDSTIPNGNTLKVENFFLKSLHIVFVNLLFKIENCSWMAFLGLKEVYDGIMK